MAPGQPCGLRDTTVPGPLQSLRLCPRWVAGAPEGDGHRGTSAGREGEGDGAEQAGAGGNPRGLAVGDPAVGRGGASEEEQPGHPKGPHEGGCFSGEVSGETARVGGQNAQEGGQLPQAGGPSGGPRRGSKRRRRWKLGLHAVRRPPGDWGLGSVGSGWSGSG